MPENTAVPSDWRISAPAPCAIISGTTPRMKAKEVIRIGRRRVRAASTAASNRLIPSSSACLANSTIRIAFLAARPTSTTKPTWARISTDRPRISKPGHGGQQAHRHDQDHRERQRPAFILGRQQQEDEDDRHAEHDQRAVCPPDVPGTPVPSTRSRSRRAASQPRCAPSHPARSRSSSPAGWRPGSRSRDRGCSGSRGTGRWCRGSSATEPIGTISPRSLRVFRLAMSAGIVAERAVRLGGHPVGPAEEVELVDEGRAQIDLQRLEHPVGRNAEHLGAQRGRYRHRPWACWC